MFKLMLTVLVLATSAWTVHAQNLVTNGSFDTPAARSELIGPANLPGWTQPSLQSASSSAYSVIFRSAEDTGSTGAHLWGGVSLILHQNPKITASPAGGSFIAIDTDPTGGSAIQQTVNGLVPGRAYTLSFYYAAAQLTTRAGATTQWWDVSFGRETRRSDVLSNASMSFTGWHAATMTFVADGASVVLSFKAGGGPSGYPPVSLLDGVSLTPATR